MNPKKRFGWLLMTKSLHRYQNQFHNLDHANILEHQQRRNLRLNGFSEIEVLRPYSEEIATEQDVAVLFKCKKPEV